MRRRRALRRAKHYGFAREAGLLNLGRCYSPRAIRRRSLGLRLLSRPAGSEREAVCWTRSSALSVVRSEGRTKERHIPITQPCEVTKGASAWAKELRLAAVATEVVPTAVNATALACGEILGA